MIWWAIGRFMPVHSEGIKRRSNGPTTLKYGFEEQNRLAQGRVEAPGYSLDKTRTPPNAALSCGKTQFRDWAPPFYYS
jgi:hypothetical protein